MDTNYQVHLDTSHELTHNITINARESAESGESIN